ncbi:ABC-three component system middle component 8 [Sphingobacterium sp. ML3W]|uniref:ABC-three component system middle component 8 n=1 Tax=Sphingobacterium sp. ML3W TaxID=1538644 RepID=UPI0026A89D32
MIKPDRHTNLKYSIINISSVILSELNAFYAIKYDTLMQKVLQSLGDDARINFPYALNFLYLMNQISYEQKTDSFKSIS